MLLREKKGVYQQPVLKRRGGRDTEERIVQRRRHMQAADADRVGIRPLMVMGFIDYNVTRHSLEQENMLRTARTTSFSREAASEKPVGETSKRKRTMVRQRKTLPRLTFLLGSVMGYCFFRRFSI